MNKVILMGRLVKDPEVRYTQSDNSTCIASFTIAVDRKFKREGEQSADFINCVAFGKTFPSPYGELYFITETRNPIRNV